MKVSDVMVHRMISVTPEATIAQAANLMLDAQISGLPVVDGQGNLVGIVTEGDLIRRVESGTSRRRSRLRELLTSSGKLAEEYTRSHGKKVGQIMTPNVHTVMEDTPLADAVDLMEKFKIKRLPVIKGGKLAGMLSRSNLLQAIVSRGKSGKTQNAADWAIRDQVLAELQKQPWAPIQTLEVVVQEGRVRLSGTILDERERGAILVAVENVPGVKLIADHIVSIEPRSGMVIYNPDASVI